MNQLAITLHTVLSLSRKLQADLERVDDTTDDLFSALAGLLHDYPDLKDASLLREILLHHKQPPLLFQVANVDLRWELRKTRVRLDNREVTLSYKLGVLLKILAANDVPADDHLVGWKSKAHLVEQMTKQSGNPTSPGAVDTLLWRLRGELTQQASLGPLLQSGPRGARLAVQRPAAPPAASPLAPGSVPN